MPVSFKTSERANGEIEYLSNWQATCFIIDRIYGVPELIKELCLNGLGADLFKTLRSSEFISIYVVVRWISIMVESFKVIWELISTFGKVELVEHSDNQFSFKVPKVDKTIGFFFGYLEDLKERYMIEEYGASQTTLEQVFNGFARQGEEKVEKRVFEKR